MVSIIVVYVRYMIENHKPYILKYLLTYLLFRCEKKIVSKYKRSFKLPDVFILFF